jgi:hypothetical protein
MSVGDSFTLFPLSNFFVRKSEAFGPAADPNAGPIPDPNVGITQPIASGRIETDGTVVTGGATGDFTWYRLSRFGGTPNTQAVEFREYLLMFRGVSANSSIVSFRIPIPDGGFTPPYGAYRAIYDQTPATTPGVGTHNWIITFTSNAQEVALDTNTGGGGGPNNESFFFYVIGI